MTKKQIEAIIFLQKKYKNTKFNLVPKMAIWHFNKISNEELNGLFTYGFIEVDKGINDKLIALTKKGVDFSQSG